MSKAVYIPAPINNYYGSPFLDGIPGSYFLCLEDYSSCARIPVSDAFAAAWLAEFSADAQML